MKLKNLKTQTKEGRFYLSPYRIMWLFVMFDLPVVKKSERKAAAEFRSSLLEVGFEMSQFSVYLKYCASSEKADVVTNKVKQLMPPHGHVDVLKITDKQWASMQRFYGRRQDTSKTEKPKQLRLF